MENDLSTKGKKTNIDLKVLPSSLMVRDKK